MTGDRPFLSPLGQSRNSLSSDPKSLPYFVLHCAGKSPPQTLPGEKRRVKRSRSHRETCGRGPRRRPGFGAGDPCLGGPAASCSCPIGHCLAPVDVISMRDSKPGTRPPVPGAPDAIASAGSRAGLRAGGQPSCLCHDESRRFWAKGRRLLRRQSPGCGRGPWPAGTPGRRVVSPPPRPPSARPSALPGPSGSSFCA